MSMTDLKIKMNEYGYLYAEMQDGTVRELLVDVYGCPYFGNIKVGKEIEAEESKDGKV